MAKQATAKESKEKLREALELLSEAAHDRRDELKTLVDSKYQGLKSAISGAEGRAAEWVGDAAEKVVHAKDLSQERLQEAGKVIDKKVREEPWKAAGLVAATAFLLGYIIGRK